MQLVNCARTTWPKSVYRAGRFLGGDDEWDSDSDKEEEYERMTNRDLLENGHGYGYEFENLEEAADL